MANQMTNEEIVAWVEEQNQENQRIIQGAGMHNTGSFVTTEQGLPKEKPDYLSEEDWALMQQSAVHTQNATATDSGNILEESSANSNQTNSIDDL